jgi:hypothetical protein
VSALGRHGAAGLRRVVGGALRTAETALAGHRARRDPRVRITLPDGREEALDPDGAQGAALLRAASALVAVAQRDAAR